MNYPSYLWNEILMYDQYFQMQKNLLFMGKTEHDNASTQTEILT